MPTTAAVMQVAATGECCTGAQPAASSQHPPQVHEEGLPARVHAPGCSDAGRGALLAQLLHVQPCLAAAPQSLQHTNQPMTCGQEVQTLAQLAMSSQARPCMRPRIKRGGPTCMRAAAVRARLSSRRAASPRKAA